MTDEETGKSWQKPTDENPYANLPGEKTSEQGHVVRLNLDDISVVSTSLGEISSPWKREILNYVHYSVKTETPGEHDILWTVHSEEPCRVEVRAVIKAPLGGIAVACGGSTVRKAALGTEPDRICLGILPLSAGLNRIHARVTVDTVAEVCSLELAKPEVARRVDAEAQAAQHQPAWFKDAGYGLMFQWTNRATPEHGDRVKPWGQKVADFNVDGFVDLVQALGARYVLWSITWGQQYIAAPVRALDAILPGRTTESDLLGEIADKLAERSIRLLFYYHFGYDCYHSIDREWMEAAGGYRADKTELFVNIREIIAEIAERYGDRLHGWYFDGGRRYYDCHWDGSAAEGPLSAPFRELALAARKGNPRRLLTFNSWVWPMETLFADYASCEWYRQYEGLVDGIITRGPLSGLQAHAAFPLEGHWGHIEFNTPIGDPRIEPRKLADMVSRAKRDRYPLTINLEMYEDGSVSPRSAETLKDMKHVLEGTDRFEQSP